jgi:hypothetical protein
MNVNACAEAQPDDVGGAMILPTCRAAIRSIVLHWYNLDIGFRGK